LPFEKKEKISNICLDAVPSSLLEVRFQNVCTSLPEHYLPEIRLFPREVRNATDFIRSNGFRAITISLSDFFTPEGRFNVNVLRVNESGGLHLFLKFKGQIILTTDINDFLCDRLNATKLYHLLKILRPDFVTTFDTYCYDDQPSFLSQIKMIETLDKISQLNALIQNGEIDVGMIGLSIGPSIPPDFRLFKWYSMCLDYIGCKVFAIPCYELRTRGDKKSRVEKIAMKIQILRDGFPNSKIILLSCSPAEPKVPASDYYSSYTWYMVKGENKDIIKSRKLLGYRKFAQEYSEQRMISVYGD
jgi:hypothetical protein